MNTPIGHLVLDDFKKAVISAFIMGAALPVALAIQTPGFDIFAADWRGILFIALNGGIVGFAGEILRRLGTNEEGKFLGAI